MKIRIIKRVSEIFMEESYHVSEIKETIDKFIFKKFLDEEIIEIKKDDLFFWDFHGTILKIKKKKGDKN